MRAQIRHGGYGSGHCWYYRTGGLVVPITAIKVIASVNARYDLENTDVSYYAFSSEVDHALAITDPQKQRSKILKAMEHHTNALWSRDIPGYRRVCRKLSLLRKGRITNDEYCDDIFMAVSLKHNHCYWHFRNIAVLDQAIESLPQGDLFGL